MLDLAQDRAGATAQDEKVLLVDDNAINLQVLFRTLEGKGYTLLVATNGEAALNIAKAENPAVVLLDIMMPEIDGFEVCRRLKADPATANAAIIFLSAKVDTESRVKGFELGASDYISKPFEASEVEVRVRTQLKLMRLEKELARRNDELEDENEKILYSIHEAIIGLDVRGAIFSFNPAAVELTGWALHDALGRSLESMGLFAETEEAEGETANDANEFIRLCYESGQEADIKDQVLHARGGDTKEVTLTASALTGGGAVIALRDISEWARSQRALAEAREQLESQRQKFAHFERLSTGEEMAAGIAHEVNQPLTAIVNYARVANRLLEVEAPDIAKMQEVLGKINLQAGRASEIIQGFRNSLRQPGLSHTPLDLNEIMVQSVALAEVDARDNGVCVDAFPCSEPLHIRGDAVQLQQVALNLLRNAFEATREVGGNFLRVQLICESDGKRAKFRVVDSGPGLSAEAKEKLFTPFSTSKESGMGVGLTISQSIIQAHGGELYYRPNPDGGAIFEASIPLSEKPSA